MASAESPEAKEFLSITFATKGARGSPARRNRALVRHGIAAVRARRAYCVEEALGGKSGGSDAGVWERASKGGAGP